MASLKPRNSSGKLLLEKLNKDLFLGNIIEARKVEGKNVENFEFNKNRCKVLSGNENIKEKSNGILYWMYRDCRVQDNWAMIFAQRIAIKKKIPLFVCYTIKDVHHQYPTQRHFKFLIEGLKLVQKECKELNIGFHIVNSSPKDIASLVSNNNIGGIVCDFSPLKHPRNLQAALLDHIPDDVPVVQVDAHNIVPVRIASEKQEGMAKFLRSKINKHLDEYLTGFPNVSSHQFKGKLDLKDDIENINDCYNYYKPKYDVPEVKWGEGPGEIAGLSMLYNFMLKNLKEYGSTSNDPSKDNTSKLSPYLNYGQISAQRCALEVKSLSSLYKEQCDKYLEELIVRRELTDNYCYYNSNYDNLEGAAGWAKDSLKLHSKDKRTWTYTREQLENAKTHDEMWNAAQLQAYHEGKIHGYMRMYWCKKILEWTQSPEQAIEYGLWLNDTFCLDGTDPNGYVGIMWSICGVHDQGWKEREIFGKIRYMVDYSLRKKFNMDAYCARFGRKAMEQVKKKKVTETSNKDKDKIKKQGIKRKAS
ncbi:deoxyribodipyrimidine photo-lyase-like [Diorhabda carinulata]|uniref:deoxyribodipyrimidine photo-lyase-like n=1 Tax=Diorhabda carinulata TaxID=1163345 RepID=UPI0025A035C3|nr:deoxyribodipyrimidine photo-lyase-like [Diorhabda carinulata]XP_057667178.1 deoxyribodipyrimidine photo-lyase-like [Diorhabda carinulata]XP_057667179.1 deoxyribodipyrimidine photo-lyase-like [Diorhabda carinulata]